MLIQDGRWLWIWLGIPVLLLAHFLRPQYHPQTISSNYLWRLSQQYRKKRFAGLPSKRFLLLILEILSILALGLLAAGAKLRLPGSGREIILVLDASASMNRADSSGTLLEKGKDAMLRAVADRPVGSGVSIVTVDGAGRVLAESARNDALIRDAIRGISPGWQADALDSALSVAQKLCRQYPGAQVTLYTDHPVESAENLAVVTLTCGEAWNAALLPITVQTGAGSLILRHGAVSYGKDAELTMGLYLDDQMVSAQTVFCPKDTAVEVVWRIAAPEEWRIARVLLPVGDALEADNETAAADPRSQAARVLLRGDETFYMEHALGALPERARVTLAEEDAPPAEGFDVYIQCGGGVDVLPPDGSVWLIDPETLPPELGFSLGERLLGADLSAPEDPADGHVHRLLENLRPDRIAVHSFREAAAYSGAVVLQCGALPAVVTGGLANGWRWIVQLFDLGHSNLPLLTDFVQGVNNALLDIAPPLLSRLALPVGEEVAFTFFPGARAASVRTPQGGETAIDTALTAATMRPDAPGLYEITVTLPDGKTKTGCFRAYVPPEESAPAGPVDSLSLLLSANEEGEGEPLDLRSLLAALLLALLLIEFGMYAYENL